MPHPTEKVELTLPTGRVVRWPAPTFSEGRKLTRLVDDVGTARPGAFEELMGMVATLSGDAPELEELIPSEAVEVALRFLMAPRVPAAAGEPSPTPSTTGPGASSSTT